MAKWKIQRRIPKDHHRQFEMRRCLYACWCSFNMEQLSIMHGQGFSQELFQEWFTFPPKKSQLDPYFRARSKESLGWGSVRGKLVLRSPGQGKSHCEDSTGVEALCMKRGRVGERKLQKARNQGLGKNDDEGIKNPSCRTENWFSSLVFKDFDFIGVFFSFSDIGGRVFFLMCSNGETLMKHSPSLLALLANPWAILYHINPDLGDRATIFFAACKRHCFLWMTQHWIWKNWLGEAERIRHWLKDQSNHWQSFVVFVDEEKLRPGCLKSHYKQLGSPEKKNSAARSAKESPKRLAFVEFAWKPERIWLTSRCRKTEGSEKKWNILDISHCIGRNYKILFNDFTPQKRWTTQTKLPKLRGHVSQKNHGILKSTVLISQNPGHSTLMVFSTLETLSWSEPNPFLAHVCEAVKRAITNSPSRYVVDTPGLKPEETERKYWNWLVKFVDLHCNLPIISNHGDLVEHKNFIYQCDHFSSSFGFKGRYLRHQRHWSWFWDLHVLVERVSSQSSQIGSFFFGWGDFFGLKNQQDQDTWSWRWWPSVSAI